MNKLASLTRIRDVEAFELSVLKTLAELLKIKQLSMYKVDDRHSSCYLLTYTAENDNQQASQGDGVEFHKALISDDDIPGYVKTAFAWIESTNSPYTLAQDDVYQTVYPVIGAKNIVGYISLQLPHRLNETEALVINSILSIAHNFHILLQENQEDKLTGLLNRKTFEDSINKIQALLTQGEVDERYSGIEKRRADSAGHFWLAIMDIDHFKRINDNYGHVYGDEVLLLVAQLMRESFRGEDLLFRFGGEEFVVILKGDAVEGVAKVLERFRRNVETYHFPQIDFVTISIGATQVTERHAIPADIVGRADQALYYAKAQGRNQLRFYEDLVASGSIKERIEEGTIELF
ncbi:GGDEF domain-containing protein [Methylomarinum sp. Ch1-1]|uniref:diguanylate cyclase n=1 Tax=Methylomarinum roseum TaxID=3067653 RepID=A0AAU7NQ70_9GAMM